MGETVRVAVVSVGNCAASLVQGVHYYGDAYPTASVSWPDTCPVRRLARA